MAEDYDNFLYSMLSKEQDITGFLDVVFEFLYRRTDFFKIKSEDNLSPPGFLAEKLVKNVFLKYLMLSKEQDKTPLSEVINDEVVSDFAAEEIISATEIGEDEATTKMSAVDSKQKAVNIEPPTEDKVYVSDPKCYNGAEHESYCWSQTLKDADVQIKVPANIESGKHVKVQIKQQHIKAEALDGSEWKVLVDDELKWKVNAEECIWTLVPKDHIHICLEKAEDRWWECLFISEQKIDIQKIDASQPYEELDEDSRAKIQELMYDQHQKRLGKPTIQQEKLSKVLQDAWDKENSPFKGQPFDPTICNIYDSETSSLPK